jgi:hypothetical protein
MDPDPTPFFNDFHILIFFLTRMHIIISLKTFFCYNFVLKFYLATMIMRKGKGTDPDLLTNGSGSGSGMPKNMRIRIRIPNTASIVVFFTIFVIRLDFSTAQGARIFLLRASHSFFCNSEIAEYLSCICVYNAVLRSVTKILLSACLSYA